VIRDTGSILHMQSSREGGGGDDLPGIFQPEFARPSDTRRRRRGGGVLMREAPFAIRPSSSFSLRGRWNRPYAPFPPVCPPPLPLRLSTPSSLSLDFFLRAGFNDLNTVAGRNRPLIQHSGTTLSFRWRTGLQTGREAWCLFFYPGGGRDGGGESAH